MRTFGLSWWAALAERNKSSRRSRLDALPTIVQAEGYPDVQSFNATYCQAGAGVLHAVRLQ